METTQKKTYTKKLISEILRFFLEFCWIEVSVLAQPTVNFENIAFEFILSISVARKSAILKIPFNFPIPSINFQMEKKNFVANFPDVEKTKNFHQCK